MIHFIQHGLRDMHSHFYGETLGFVQAAKELKRDLQVWTHARCEPQIVEAFKARAVFPLQTDGVVDSDPVSSELSSYIVGAAAFASTLGKFLTPDITADDWVYVAYASQNEVYAVASWMQTLSAEKRPRLALFCHRPELKWSVDPHRETVSANASFWRFAARMLEQIGAKDRVQVFAPDLRLVEFLGWASGLKVSAAGISTPYFLTPAQALSSPKRFDIGLIGEFRAERGSEIIPDLMIALDRLRPGMRYVLQLTDSTEQEAVQKKLADQGFMGSLSAIANNHLETAEFARLIAQVRLMVLPYHPQRYRMRSSGVLSECIAYATPCVVPSSTWLGDQLKDRFAAGEAFDGWTSDAVCSATVRAFDALDALTKTAEEKMLPWRQRNCARAMLERLA